MTNELSLRDEFEALFTPILPSAFATALRLTNARDDAEDLLQDASIRAFNGLHQFERGTNFKAWFARLLVTTFLNAKRKQNAAPPTVELEGEDDIADLFLYQHAKRNGLLSRDDPAARLMQRFESDEIGAALAALPDEFRIVSVLSLVQQMSYEEISRALDVPLGTVRSRLHRSRKLLQKALWELAVEKGLIDEPRA